MRLRVLFLLLLLAIPVQAANRITAVVTFTNEVATTNGTLFVINAATRIFTNAVTDSSTQVLTNSTAAGSKTNLFNQLALNPVTSVTMINLGATNFSLVSAAGVNLTVTFPARFGSVVYSTQVVATAASRAFPIDSYPTAAVRTNDASDMVYAQESYSTNSLNQNSFAASELVGLTNVQTVSGAKSFTSASGLWRGVVNSPSLSGTATLVTNGYFTNAVLDGPTLTNAVNYGNAFSSPGSADSSEQFGTGAAASGESSFAAGNTAQASGLASVALGNSANATEEGAIAVGFGPIATAPGSIAIGYGAASAHTNSTALGFGATTTISNQVRLGTSAQFVSIPGNLHVLGSSTNNTMRGTNVFPAGADLSFGRYAITTLANGANSVSLGTNVFIQVSGPSGAFTINGMDAQPNRDGALRIILNYTGQNMTVAHDSGTEPVAANRIYTMTGADHATTANGCAMFLYSTSASRWILINLQE